MLGRVLRYRWKEECWDQLAFRIRDNATRRTVRIWESEATEATLFRDKAVYQLLEVSDGESVLHQSSRLGSYVIYATCLISGDPVISSWSMKEKEVAVECGWVCYIFQSSTQGANTLNSQTADLLGEERKISQQFFSGKHVGLLLSLLLIYNAFFFWFSLFLNLRCTNYILWGEAIATPQKHFISEK